MGIRWPLNRRERITAFCCPLALEGRQYTEPDRTRPSRLCPCPLNNETPMNEPLELTLARPRSNDWSERTAASGEIVVMGLLGGCYRSV